MLQTILLAIAFTASGVACLLAFMNLRRAEHIERLTRDALDRPDAASNSASGEVEGPAISVLR